MFVYVHVGQDINHVMDFRRILTNLMCSIIYLYYICHHSSRPEHSIVQLICDRNIKIPLFPGK